VPDLDEEFTRLLQKDADPVEAGVVLKRLSEQESPDLARWLSILAAQRSALSDADAAVLGGLLRLIHLKLLRDQDGVIGQIPLPDLTAVLHGLPASTPNRHLLLQLLAMRGDADSLVAMVSLLRQSPPRGWMAAGQILSPLMQRNQWPVEAIFPGLLDLLDQPALASPVLDLAGHLVRSGRLAVHPAAERIDSINGLLGAVADRLARFEEDPRSFGDEVDQVQAILGEAVALAVSLCDAAALIGDESSLPALYKAVDLKHRRVQCEAAGAMAKLGDEAGRERLVELAKEPSARLRAIAYADELGFGDQIDPAHRTPEATAEADMALWLSQPQQMGVAPTGVEVVDSRRLLWPSFHDPVDVYLVRFEYRFGDRCLSNIGMTGPAVFSFSADVADLPVEDIYAMYAGWHAEHPDIFTVSAQDFNDAQLRRVEPLSVHLHRSGYAEVHAALLGFFLDETAAVFRAIRDGKECLVVTDGLETIEVTTAGRQRPVSPEDVFHLYKGRKMLRTFNP